MTEDIYPLGLIGYNIFHGCLPFERESGRTKKAVTRRMDGEPVSFRPDLNPALKSVLAYDPGNTYPNASAFKEDLLALN